MRDALSDMYGDKDKAAKDDGQKTDAPPESKGNIPQEEQPPELTATSKDRPTEPE